MLAGLNDTSPGKYEPALTQLGKFLGAEAFKPDGQGRCDSLWCWDNSLWIAVEAKSDQTPHGLVTHRYVRQANDQLRIMASDRACEPPPPNSVTLIVSRKPGVDNDGVLSAEPHVHLVTPNDMLDIAQDAKQAWDDLMARTFGVSDSTTHEPVRNVLAQHGLLASQVRDRLTHSPIKQR